MNATWRKSLVWFFVLLLTVTNLSVFSVAADSHSLAECRQQFSDELLAQFYAQAGDRDTLMQNGTLSGIYLDSQATLHIAVTDGSNRAAYEQLFSADTLATLADKHLTDTHCQHTAAELTKDAIVFEQAAVSLAQLHTMQDALTPHLTELGIYQTSVLEDKNALEICTENADNRAGIINWLSRNIDGFDEDAVRILVQPNSIKLEGETVWLGLSGYQIAIIGGAVVLVAAAAVAAVLLLRHRRKCR